MGNYDDKLGEWLKYVQQQVDAVGQEEQEEEKPKETPKPETRIEERVDRVDRMERMDRRFERTSDLIIRDRLDRVIASDVEDVEDSSVIADSSLVERNLDDSSDTSVLDEMEVPEVEDYLPFLKEPEIEMELPPEPEIPSEQRLLFETDGTGEAKPVIPTPEPPAVIEEPIRVVRHAVTPPVAPETGDVGELWDKLPKHIQFLVGQHPSEIAQNSYKRFKETREDMVARLLDPPLSLEEAARILNVCPTTVRRYTNRGALKHYRTAGNQRRFRLSDVLGFLESTTRTSSLAGSIEQDI